VADVSVALNGLSGRLYRHARDRYSGFATTSPADVVVDVEVVTSGDIQCWPRFAAVVEPLPISPTAYRLSRQGEPFDAEIDVDAGTCTAVIADDILRLDLFLSTLYSILLALKGRMLVYGAAVHVEGHAVLIAGESSSNDAALMSAGFTDVIVDGMAAVARDGEGFNVYSTPFLCETCREPRFGIHARDRKAPLTALYLSRPDETNCISQPRTGSVLFTVLGYTHFFGPHELSPTVYSIVEDLLLSRFAGELHWTPTKEVVPLVESLASPSAHACRGDDESIAP
jgi:hypothetical protein